MYKALRGTTWHRVSPRSVLARDGEGTDDGDGDDDTEEGDQGGEDAGMMLR